MPNEYGTTVFLKNIVRAENIIVGDYTYYDDSHDPMGWEKNNVLFNYPFFNERLVIGRYCSLSEGSTYHGGCQSQAVFRDDLSFQRDGRGMEGKQHSAH